MAQVSPIILNGILTDLRDGSAVQIVVDSSDWYAWLQTASTFTFRGEEGLFTAHKERAGHRRGRAYWRAYRTWHGKLHRAYLGQSEELTLERLRSVAVALASKETGNGLLDVPGLGARTRSPAEAASRARTHRRRTTGAQGPHEAALSNPWLARFPVPLTALIGREQEVRAICDLLSQPEVRLLTITGTGGVGKTRLALEVAGVLRADFADGACFVPLAPVSDPARVLAAIAQALGLWEAGDLPVEEQLHAALRERHLLLLLDNFEQVVQAAPQLASLLASCPRLRLLVTSRATLHLSGEHEFPVLPLAVPNLTQLPSPETLTQQAAVRLFVLRAQAIQPAFGVTPANACAIAEICVHLDGLPLAIELAAARSKLLPPQALLARLSRRLEVLTGGARDLPTRQQTLRNTLQWSYDLLTEQEQRLFRRLSIFVGGCTLEAAEAVCQAGGDQASSVLEGIASLLDKSLVQQTEREGGEPRLVMLETIREFGLECLHRQGELQAARQAHARYYLALAEQAEPHFFGPEQLLWVNRLERDLDNLRAILQAGIAGGAEEREVALRLGAALQVFWIGRGYLQEGRSFLEPLLAGAGALAASVRFRALTALGAILVNQSDWRGLEPVADEALVLAQEQGDQWQITRALITRGAAMMQKRSDYAQAQACLEEALTSAGALGDRYLLFHALLNLGRLALNQQDAPRAIAWYEESLIQGKAMGAKLLIGRVLVGLARAELSVGHAARARTLMEEGLTISRALGNTIGTATFLTLLGQLAFQQGELSQAEAFLTDSTRLATEVGDRRNVARSRLLLAGVAALRGDHAAARQRYEEGLSTALDIGHVNYIGAGLKGLGCVAAAQGLPTWAAVLWGTAEPLRESRSLAIPQALHERMVAEVRGLLGEPAFEEARARGRTMTAAQALASHEAFAPQATPRLPPAQAAPGSSPTAPARHPSSPAGLTAREVEVLRLVSQGLTDAQVAEQLVISLRTVTTHLTSIYNKLGVNSRVAATRFAVEHQLV
jgi:predicted ATPase/DNA-binding CsgD family transcriptional regulator